MGKLLTKSEVCNLINIPAGTLRGIMARRELRCYRIGGCVRFDTDDVTEYVRRQAIHAVPVMITPAAGVPSVGSRGSHQKPVQTCTGYYPGMKVV